MTAAATGVAVGAASATAIGSGNFVVNDGSNSYGGMYVNTSAVGNSFYGFAHNGDVVGWMEVDTASNWKLLVESTTVMTARPNGNVSIGTTNQEGGA
ncbi:MAG TPA: hypothetical protein PKA27_15680 [Fimbriimonadaceae bacterium]|nr:hypothetical protein [Fimbriimonadaceae bacterium]